MRTQQRVANVVALVVISLCLLVPAALAQDCPELVGVLPGSIRLVTASGDYAYFQYFNSGFCWRF